MHTILGKWLILLGRCCARDAMGGYCSCDTLPAMILMKMLLMKMLMTVISAMTSLMGVFAADGLISFRLQLEGGVRHGYGEMLL